MSDPFAHSRGPPRPAGVGAGRAGFEPVSSGMGPGEPAWHSSHPPDALGAGPGGALSGSMGPMQMLPAQQSRGHVPQAPAAYAAAAPLTPASFAPFMADPAMQVLAQGGMAYLGPGIKDSATGVTAALVTLRTYFAVNNQYVLWKLWVSCWRGHALVGLAASPGCWH